MLNQVLYIIGSILIGGIIGGGTNRLAIAMLFRPYRTKYIGSWALPFTPGLIPKRRHELALQLGRTVREYLVNGEALNRTVRSPRMQKLMAEWVKDKWRKTPFDSLRTWIEREERRLQLPRDMRVGDWFHDEAKREIEQRVMDWAPEVNKLFTRYLTSDKGTDILRKIYADWTRKQGWFGRLTGTLIDDDKVVEKSQEWLVQALAAPRGIDMTRTLLRQMSEAVFDWRVQDVLEWAEQNSFRSHPLLQETVEGWIEWAVPYGLERLAAHAEEWLDLLHLETLVTEQIETFSLEKLEEMIVRVAKKELKLITWIGVLIGGIIGFCQGLMAVILW